jgi:hypothetical protein
MDTAEDVRVELSFVRVRGGTTPRVVMIVLAAINAVAATITAFDIGITPDAYVDNMPSMVTAFVAIISGTLAFAGGLQLNPELDHSGEVIQIVDRSKDEAELV